MGSFGWTGSVVPHLLIEIDVLTPLLSHALPPVRDWARQRIEKLTSRIEFETVREEEWDHGIH